MLVRQQQLPLQTERSHRHHCWDRRFQSFHRLLDLLDLLDLLERGEAEAEQLSSPFS